MQHVIGQPIPYSFCSGPFHLYIKEQFTKFSIMNLAMDCRKSIGCGFVSPLSCLVWFSSLVSSCKCILSNYCSSTWFSWHLAATISSPRSSKTDQVGKEVCLSVSLSLNDEEAVKNDVAKRVDALIFASPSWRFQQNLKSQRRIWIGLQNLLKKCFTKHC